MYNILELDKVYSLETIEQKCLAFLKESAQPLVSVDTLLHHLYDDPDTATIPRHLLIDFLERHEFFCIFPPVGFAAGNQMAQELALLGFSSSPMVALEARLPASDQTFVLLEMQLMTLLDALEKALAETQENKPEGKKAKRICEMIDTTHRLIHKVHTLGKGDTSESRSDISSV